MRGNRNASLEPDLLRGRRLDLLTENRRGLKKALAIAQDALRLPLRRCNGEHIANLTRREVGAVIEARGQVARDQRRHAGLTAAPTSNRPKLPHAVLRR